MREREALFSDFVSDVRRKEKEEKSQQKEKVCIARRHKVCWLFHDQWHRLMGILKYWNDQQRSCLLLW